jgi:uncharacterized protein YjiS (DUF1127 family)
MFGPWIKSYRHWRLQRRAINALHSFDDRRLADIGTFRDSIELFVAARAQVNRCEE